MNKKIITNVLSFAVVLLVVVVNAILLFSFVSNTVADSEAAYSGKDIEVVTIDKSFNDGNIMGLYETKMANNKYFYLGYYDIYNQSEGIVTVDEKSRLFIASSLGFLWKVKIYVAGDNLEVDDLRYYNEDYSEYISPIIEKDKFGSYFYIDFSDKLEEDYWFVFSKETVINKIEIFYEKITKELYNYELGLNVDGGSYYLESMKSKIFVSETLPKTVFAIMPDTFKGKPVTDYIYKEFVFAHMDNFKIGANIKKIYSKTFSSNTRVLFSINGTVEEIQKEAFYRIKNLENLYIPAYLKSINSKFVSVDSQNSYVDSVKLIFEGYAEIDSPYTESYVNIKRNQLVYENKMTFIVDDNNATLIDVDNDLKTVNVPEKVSGKFNVTKIGNNIKTSLDYMYKIVLPDSVVEIGNFITENFDPNQHYNYKFNDYLGTLYIGSNSNPYLYCYGAEKNTKILVHEDCQYFNNNFYSIINENYLNIEGDCGYIGREGNPYYYCVKIGLRKSLSSYVINANTKWIIGTNNLYDKNIVLPKDLEYIMPSAYKNSGKCSFEIDPANEKFITYKGSLYQKVDNGYELIFGSVDSIIEGEFKFLDNCVKIKTDSLKGLEISSLIIPGTVKEIEKKALSEESISKMTIPASLEKADDIFKYLSFNTIFDEIIIDANNKLFKKKDLMIVSIDEKVLYREFVDSAIFMVPEYIEKLSYNSVLASSVIIHENVYVVQNNFLNFNNHLYSKIFLLDEVKAGYYERWDENVNKVYTGDSFTLYNGIIYAVEKNKVSAVSYYDTENPLTIADTVRINRVSYDVTGIDNYAFVNAKFYKDIYIPNKITTIGTNAFHEIVNAEGKDYFNVFIPSSVEKIQFGGFYATAKTLNIYCEAPVKPQGWNNQCFRVSQIHGTGNQLNVYYNQSGIPKEE